MLDVHKFIERILDDESLTTGLEDPEGRLLVEWLVEQAERLATQTDSEAQARQLLEQLCRWARAVRRFLLLWCYEANPGAASQLAAAERFPWPLPPPQQTDAVAVLRYILDWHRQIGQTGHWIPGNGKSASGSRETL
ncbi:MAG: hypothetical protein RMJ19_07860 [Gemmatales bacterium]|nr:hypothetical protein [Gemmatales bacterium]MCS7160371.1 hypothetical protein [Gemmatales bacterium]MDW8175571.1 hypothetical protein [Gemmatales bacterium]MDW8221471.1 hypothetical protein [Gemmatales bacterium]